MSAHRSHAHYSQGRRLTAMIAEIYGGPVAATAAAVRCISPIPLRRRRTPIVAAPSLRHGSRLRRPSAQARSRHGRLRRAATEEGCFRSNSPRRTAGPSCLSARIYPSTAHACQPAHARSGTAAGRHHRPPGNGNDPLAVYEPCVAPPPTPPGRGPVFLELKPLARAHRGAGFDNHYWLSHRSRVSRVAPHHEFRAALPRRRVEPVTHN